MSAELRNREILQDEVLAENATSSSREMLADLLNPPLMGEDSNSVGGLDMEISILERSSDFFRSDLPSASFSQPPPLFDDESFEPRVELDHDRVVRTPSSGLLQLDKPLQIRSLSPAPTESEYTGIADSLSGQNFVEITEPADSFGAPVPATGPDEPRRESCFPPPTRQDSAITGNKLQDALLAPFTVSDDRPPKCHVATQGTPTTQVTSKGNEIAAGSTPRKDSACDAKVGYAAPILPLCHVEGVTQPNASGKSTTVAGILRPQSSADDKTVFKMPQWSRRSLAHEDISMEPALCAASVQPPLSSGTYRGLKSATPQMLQQPYAGGNGASGISGQQSGDVNVDSFLADLTSGFASDVALPPPPQELSGTPALQALGNAAAGTMQPFPNSPLPHPGPSTARWAVSLALGLPTPGTTSPSHLKRRRVESPMIASAAMSPNQLLSLARQPSPAGNYKPGDTSPAAASGGSEASGPNEVIEMYRPSTSVPSESGRLVTKSGKRKRTRVEDLDPTQVHVCSFEDCRKKFAKKYNLKIHERRHRGDLPFICEQCGKKFMWHSSFERHLRVHEAGAARKKLRKTGGIGGGSGGGGRGGGVGKRARGIEMVRVSEMEMSVRMHGVNRIVNFRRPETVALVASLCVLSGASCKELEEGSRKAGNMRKMKGEAEREFADVEDTMAQELPVHERRLVEVCKQESG